MKALTATGRTQGDRPGDFHHAIDGELVYLSLVCDRDAFDPDGGCGCGRSFAGLNSHKATTTAEVVDLDFSGADYLEAIASSLEQAGWGRDDADDIAHGMLAVADEFPVGTVVGRRLDDVHPR